MANRILSFLFCDTNEYCAPFPADIIAPIPAGIPARRKTYPKVYSGKLDFCIPEII